MPFEVSGAAEPLELEANNQALVDEAPDAEFLQELGLEAQSTSKPGETTKEAVEDVVDELAGMTEPELVSEPEKDKQEVLEPKQNEVDQSRSGKRIQQLIQERRELQRQLSEERQRTQLEMQKMQMEMQHQTEMLRKEQEYLREQVVSKSTEQDLSKLTPVERYERELVERAKAEALRTAEAKYDKELAALREAVEGEKAAREKAQKDRETRRKNQTFAAQAEAAAKQNILSAASLEGADADTATNLVLSYVAATGEDPEVAARQFSAWLDKYHQARLKKVSQTSGKQIQKSQAAPTPVQSRGGTVQGEAKPAWDTLRKHGYRNYVEWMRRGSPTLK